MLQLAEKSTNAFFKRWPRAGITEPEWRHCRLVAHRGCHDAGATVHENTIAAFESAIRYEVWGAELDVQWTRDRVPVVIHDPNTLGLPGKFAVEVGQVDFAELRRSCPVVPRFDEVVECCAGRIHMMIELKDETFSHGVRSNLRDSLVGLNPQSDYHILSLNPRTLRALEIFPVEALLLVATTNTSEMFREFTMGGIGGFTGHYLLLNRKMRRHFAENRVPWGTGFVDSMNLLAREIRAGTNWMFTDAAAHLSEMAARKFSGSNC